MKWILFLLGLANVLLWQLMPDPVPALNPDDLREKIQRLKAEIAKLEKTAAWVERVSGVLANPPSGAPDTFLELVGKEAGTTGFTLLQARAVGGEPLLFAFSGFADYETVAKFLSSLQRKPYVLFSRLELERRNDGNVRASCEVKVRRGPWQGDGGGDGLLEPVPGNIEDIALGKRNLFGEEAGPQPVAPPPRVQVKYVGYYDSGSRMTVMLEINGKSYIGAPGDTFAGLELVSATKTEIRLRGNTREEWSVRLEGGTR